MFLTPLEIAERMRVSKMTIYRLIHLGELPATKVGSSYRVAQADFETWLAQNKMGGQP